MNNKCEQGHSASSDALFCPTCGATIEKSKTKLTKKTQKAALSLALIATIFVTAVMFFGGNSIYTLRAGQTIQDSIMQPSCLPNGSCIATGAGTTFRSSNSGKSWVRYAAVPGGLMQQIECQTDAVCVAVGHTYLGDVWTSYSSAWISFDKGVSWRRTYFSYPDAKGSLFTVSCPTTMSCLAAGDRTVIATSTGGASWHDVIQVPGTKISPRYLKCFNSTDCFMASVEYSGDNNVYTIFRTTDFGFTWKKAGSLKNATWPFNCFSSNKCVTTTEKYNAKGATIGNYLTSTSDGGKTWSNSPEIAQLKNKKKSIIEDASCSTMTNCVVLANEYLHPYSDQSNATDPEYILQTTNGGKSWSKIEVPSYWRNLVWVTCLPTSRCIVGASPPNAANLTQTKIFTLK